MTIKLLNPNNIPYALFRFNGKQIAMNERQFKQAVADGKICRCGTCLACRAAEYQRDADAQSMREAGASVWDIAATLDMKFKEILS